MAEACAILPAAAARGLTHIQPDTHTPRGPCPFGLTIRVFHRNEKCARLEPSALDIFLDPAIAMADPPMTNPAEGLMFGCRRAFLRKAKRPDRCGHSSPCLIRPIISSE